MGVKFDRLFDDVTGTFTEIQGLAKPVPGTISGTAAAGYLISPAINDAFTIANRVLKANGEVYRTGAPTTANGRTYPAGSFYVAASATTHADRAGGGEGARRQHGRDERPSGAEAHEAGREADRAVGHADRLDAVRLDALPARAFRVPLHRRLRRRVR